MATDESKHVQEQVLDAIKQSRDAALQAISTWSENVGKLAAKLPEMPKLPITDALPKPGDLSDQFFEFAQELLSSQQKFVERLMAALPGQDTTSS